MNNLLVSTAFLLLFWSGCQKVDVGPPVSNDPIFTLKGQLDGQLFEWQAGKDSIYMLATFNDSTANEPRFIADLGQLESPTSNGFPKIVIEFFGEGSAANWPDILTARKVDFAEKSLVLTQKRVLLLQNNSVGKAPFQTLWGVGGQSSAAFSPVFEFDSLDFQSQIMLQSTDSEGRTTRQLRFLDLKNEREWSVRLSKFQGKIFAQTNSPDSIANLKWNNGSMENFIFIDSTFIQNTVAATFSGGKQATAEMMLDPQNPFSQNFAAADFSWQTFIKTDTTIGGTSFQTRRVLIHYFNENGQEFRSDQVAQGTANFFEIVSVEDFERNEAGILTKKITVKFDCVLADEKGVTRKMSSVEGVIAVGVPD